MDCPNLKGLYGDQYRVVVEESYYADSGNTNRVDVDPWYYVLQCRKGDIVPWDEGLLAACTNSRGPVVKQLVAAGCEIVQDGSDGMNATFPVEAFDEVADIMRPRRRRLLSPEQRAICTERLRKHRFVPAAQVRESDEERTISSFEVSPLI